MYLKEVRLENFKSFGRRLTVPFRRGFTAITGPNGAGKSNIGDAILFVLGARSRKEIRAGRLTDLIFNGGKSGSGADYCRVSLAFDNADRLLPVDADEVVLTRKVRRAPSKEDPEGYYSYFYVNERAASLKEFVDILAHARIAADGYNIVKQGDITKIVEMGPIERRRILEDIAGITEFDADIERAEKRRGEVTANLERVGIVLDEIKRQLRGLKEQRDAAARFAELTGKLKLAKARLATRKKREVEAQVAGVQKQIASFEAEKAKLEKRYEQLKEELRAAQIELSDIESKMEAAGDAESRELQAQLAALREKAIRAEEALNHARDEAAGLAEERASLGLEAKKLEKDLARREKERGELAAEAERAARRAAETEAELNRLRDIVASGTGAAGELARELARLKEQHEKALAAFHEAELEAAKANVRLEALRREVAELEEAEKTAQVDAKDLQFEIEGLRKETRGAEKTRGELEKELADQRKRQAEVTKELTELEAAIRGLQAEFERSKAHLAAQEEVQLGYARAVSAVLEARDSGKLKGIHGTVAELGDVDAKYEVAVQIAAGGRLQAVVVDTDATAQKAIEYLRERKLGRAMFLPLNKMVPTHPQGKALLAVKAEGSHGFALDLITFDAKFRTAFSFVFGATVVMQDLDVARKHMGGVRLVTLQGDLLEASGAMIGGSVERESGPKFRGGEKASDDTGRKLQAALTHQDALVEELTGLRQAMQELEAKLSQTAITGSGGEARLDELVARLESSAKELDRVEKELEAKRGVLEKEEKGLAALAAKRTESQARLAALDKEKEAKSRLMLAGTKKEIAEQVRRLEATMSEAQRAAADLHAQVQVVDSTLGLEKARLAEMTAKLGRVEASLATFKADAERFAQEHAAYQEKAEALAKVDAQRSGKVRELQKRRDAAFARMKDLESEVRAVGDRRETHFTLIVKAQAQLPALEEVLGELLVELRQLNVALEENARLPGLDDLKVEIGTLERDIEGLGPINQMALEEFEKQDARKSELLEEVARLEQQRDELVKVVGEIATKKKDGFLKVFRAIDENFRRVYPLLQVGGEARLELENEPEPFLGGLTMKVRPRGKKVNRLEALSGGEKSMTALAFIFAIQDYDPSPFYVLDEVDMFLDGVNSDVVGQMVRAKAQKAQFILVSLRKVTLRQADYIYGVTMQREGLSEMIANFDITRISDEEERRAVEEARKRVEEELGPAASEEPTEEELAPAQDDEAPRRGRRVKAAQEAAPAGGGA